MNQKEFLSRQQAAVEQMRAMRARADTVSQKSGAEQKQPEKREKPPEKKPAVGFETAGFNIPLLNKLMSDSDTTLIVGLILILMGDDADKMLLLALVYILI